MKRSILSSIYFSPSFRNFSLSFRRKPESSQTIALAERTSTWIPRSSRGMTDLGRGMTDLGRGMTDLGRGMTKLGGGMTELKGRTAGLSSGMARLRGFTLLEVMIALLVITLGMAAVINTTSESGWKSAQLRHKTIATWVAQNQIVKYRANRIWGTARSQSGKVEMANIDWEWRMKISGTDDPSLRRLDVEVSIDGEDAVKARLTGFIARI